jgi:predicted lipoprotein with Yx(FWY)xxD motif
MRGRVIRLLPAGVLAAAAAVAAVVAVSASAQNTTATVKAVSNKTFGTVLVAANGHTLYRFTPDSKGVSTCTGSCATFWPPLLVKAGVKPTAGAGINAALLGTIKAAHGKAQVTYAGFPLYFFAADTAPGQTNGQGVMGKWYVVNKHGGLVKHAMSGSSHTTTTSSTTTSSSSSSAWG